MQQKILEIEQICDSVKIVVTREGKISITPLSGKDVSVDSLKMPPQKFWDNLASLIKNMNEHLVYSNSCLEKQISLTKILEETCCSLTADLDKIKETPKKIMPININKKQMFIAGMTMGKNMK